MHSNTCADYKGGSTGCCCYSRKRISWKGIFAGVVSALVLEALLNLLGAGIGLISFATDKDVITGIGIGSAIWLIIVSIIALFVGGWIASFASGRILRKTGALQGFITWGIATLITLFLTASTMGALISGATGLIGKSLSSASSMASNSTDLANNTGITSLNDRLKPGVTKDKLVRDLRDPVISYASADSDQEKNDAKQRVTEIIVQDTTLSTEEVDQKVNDLEQSYKDMKQKASDAAEKTTNVLGSMAIAAFFSFLLSGVAAIIGGALGVIGNRHENKSTFRHDDTHTNTPSNHNLP